MSETETPEAPRRKKRARSPSYPGITLEQAIDRARVIYDNEARNAAPFEAILDHWGYSPRSGAGSVALAALRKYGLLVYEGQSARLSDLALTILWNEEDSEERREAIKEAALKPSIHAELWRQYEGSLPSDATLRLELRRRGFAETAIPEFITIFRSTLAFSQLTEADRLLDKNGDTAETQVGPNVSMTATPPLPVRKPTPGAPPPIQLPLLGGTVVTLQASGPVTEEAWEQMMTVLQALKPGFVSRSAVEDDAPTD
ncbi:MAG: hypothetical protein ACRDNY_11140 [Gaiellaceae bacterium]